MKIVAYFDLEHYQMDVRTEFLNGELSENVYMIQPRSFEVARKERMVYKLQKSIYGLEKASRHWYLKFNQIVTSYGYKENVVN